MSDSPQYTAADDNAYVDDALKPDATYDDTGADNEWLLGEDTSLRHSLAAGADDVSAVNDGTGLHISEELMAEEWDDDLR